MSKPGTIVGSPTFGSVKFGSGLTAISDANYISLPAGVLPASGDFTLEVNITLPSAANTSGTSVFFSLYDGTNEIWMGAANGSLLFVSPGSNPTSLGTLADGVNRTIEVDYNSSTNIFTIYSDGNALGTQTPAGSINRATATGLIGSYHAAGHSWPGSIGYVAIWQGQRHTAAFTPTSSAYAGTEQGLAELYKLAGNANDSVATNTGTATPPANPTTSGNIVLVFHGDSLTAGYQGSNQNTIQATRLATVIGGLASTVTAYNSGVSGQTIAQMIGNAPAVVDSKYEPGKTFVLVVQGGHNDFSTVGGSADVATVIQRIRTYLFARKVAHPDVRIVWCTEPPASYSGYPANFDTLRSQVNAFMRVNWKAMGISVLSDFASDAIMGQTGQSTNQTYYSSDNVHPNDTGYTRWGFYDLGAVQQAIAGEGASRPIGYVMAL